MHFCGTQIRFIELFLWQFPNFCVYFITEFSVVLEYLTCFIFHYYLNFVVIRNDGKDELSLPCLTSKVCSSNIFTFYYSWHTTDFKLLQCMYSFVILWIICDSYKIVASNFFLFIICK